MYCIHCGNNLPDDSKFCSACGKAVELDISVNNTVSQSESFAEDNPYASVMSEPKSQQAVTTEPTYSQPMQNPYPAYQVQNTPFTPQPQYFRPVQTPQGVQYVPVEPVSYYRNPVTPPKHNPFTFISAGVTAIMFLVALLPWFTLDGKPYNIYKMLDYSFMLEHYGVEDFGICAILMFICIALLIPSFILALVKRNRMPLVFPIITTAITIFSLLIFVSVMPSYSYVLKSTPVPILLLLLSTANLVFPILARKK